MGVSDGVHGVQERGSWCHIHFSNKMLYMMGGDVENCRNQDLGQSKEHLWED